MIKFSILLRRKQSLTHEEFVAYHKNQHAPLFSRLQEVKDNVRKYVQCHAMAENLPGLPPPLFDGITEIWFDSVEGFAKVFSSAAYMQIIRPDEENFLDLHSCGFLISNENPVIN